MSHQSQQLLREAGDEIHGGDPISRGRCVRGLEQLGGCVGIGTAFQPRACRLPRLIVGHRGQPGKQVTGGKAGRDGGWNTCFELLERPAPMRGDARLVVDGTATLVDARSAA